MVMKVLCNCNIPTDTVVYMKAPSITRLEQDQGFNLLLLCGTDEKPLVKIQFDPTRTF
jgi:hypothetical protein